MWLMPIGFGVGTLFGRATGKTWISSAAYAGAVTWTTNQVYGLAIGRAGALGRLATAGQVVLTMTVGQLLAGVALGVAGGIGTSQLLFGDEGRKDAIDFYRGRVSLGEQIETYSKVPSRVKAIVAANRAVENNAAGLPTGMPIDPSTNQPRGFNSPSGKNPFDYGPGHEPLY